MQKSKTKQQQKRMSEADYIKFRDNIAIGINAINRFRFATGRWNRLYSLNKALSYVNNLCRKEKIDRVEASWIFKENAKKGEIL